MIAVVVIIIIIFEDYNKMSEIGLAVSAIPA